MGEKVRPLEVKPAPYTSPKDNEIVVKNAAIAINPVDWATQALAVFPLEYPRIWGMDMAGVVFEVGKSVTRFKPGDRVLSLAFGWATTNNSENAFQEYVVCLQHFTSHIPDDMTFEEASVFPVCISTAATGLFQKDYLGLDFPSIEAKSNGKAVLVWGGASSVGCNAIQLAVNAGYEVITTVSAKNFDYVRKLGAQPFDYNNDKIIDQLVEALKGKNVAVFDAITKFGAYEKCVEVVEKVDAIKFIPTVQPVKDSNMKNKFIMYSHDGSCSRIFTEFLEDALEKKKMLPAPKPLIVGKGLESIQEGLDRCAKGVSAEKVVVSLDI